jgi:TP53 regulating kinase-like protein
MELISQGAEAVIYRDGNEIVKNRVAKSYRLPAVDSLLRGFRTRREAKVISKLNSLGIHSPKLIRMDDKEMVLRMEFIDGTKLRDCLEKDAVKYGSVIGKNIALMHQNDIVHGDLTTSNMILHGKAIYMIDFGLSFFSKKVEDKAVDLHLLRCALESKHNTVFESCFNSALKSYAENYADSAAVVKRLEMVEKRGRNKEH